MSTIEILNKYYINGGTKDQFFLINQNNIDFIIESSCLSRSDIVLEIGGGIGNLSEHICNHVKKLYIVELDILMVKILKKRLIDEYNFENVEIIHANILNFNIEALKFNKIISNLPYSISSEFTLKLQKLKFQFAILMYQKEFADRLLSKPNSKNYGRLTVTTQEKMNIKLLKYIPKEDFYPIPKVDSAIIKITPSKINESIIITNRIFYENMLRCLFQYRRKKIKNILLMNGNYLKIKNLNSIINKSLYFNFPKKISCYLELRPENLEYIDFVDLANYLYINSDIQCEKKYN